MDMIWQGAGPFRKTSLPLRKTEAAPLVKRAGPFQETSRLVLAVGDARSTDAAAFQTVSLPSRIRRSVASVFGQNRVSSRRTSSSAKCSTPTSARSPRTTSASSSAAPAPSPSKAVPPLRRSARRVGCGRRGGRPSRRGKARCRNCRVFPSPCDPRRRSRNIPPRGRSRGPS